MSIIDSHAHLDLPEFSHDLDAVIQRALDSGIDSIITVGIGMDECRKALEIAARYPFIYATLGMHPHNAAECDRAAIDFIEKNAADAKVVALGEMGLDFFRNRSPGDAQRSCFRDQLGLARSLNMPVVIHDRDAHDETVAILREEHAHDMGGVLHCFSGDTAMAFACIDMGFYISIPGTVTFKSAQLIQEVVRNVPLEHLLIETDCPFLTPAPYRGKRNEPSYVRLVAEKIAQIKQLPIDEVARATATNTRKVFRL
ncbi:MAG: TatD family hydrolase [Deltaproteobacteria bacterium]|nr:TatD family hydrolase [Deltaproteobacteria bacterium]